MLLRATKQTDTRQTRSQNYVRETAGAEAMRRTVWRTSLLCVARERGGERRGSKKSGGALDARIAISGSREGRYDASDGGR